MKRRTILSFGTISSVIATAALLVGASGIASAAPISYNEYPTPTSFSGPYDIAPGPNGTLWFTESQTNKIGEISTNGTITEFTIPTSSSIPRGIVEGPDHNIWFTEIAGNKIGEVNTTTNAVTDYAITSPTSNPEDITVGSNGNLWFTEYATNKIGEFNPTTHAMVNEFAAPGGVYGIVGGPDNNLWYTENNTNDLGTMNMSGTVLHNYPTGDTNYPQSITVGPDNNLWATEQPSSGNAANIIKMTTGGVATTYAVPSSPGIGYGITAGPDGNLWFVNQGNNTLARITTAGVVTEFGLNTNVTPQDVALGPDNNLWIAENGTNNIARVNVTADPGAVGQAVTVSVNTATIIDTLTGATGNFSAGSVTIVTAPSHGLASVNATTGNITYTPDNGYNGTDSLTYSVCSLLDPTSCTQETINLNVGHVTSATPDTGYGSRGSNTALIAATLGVGVMAILIGAWLLKRHAKRS
jgi:virginiamycin B lyase